MPWLQLTEMVPDQEEQDKRDAAAAEAAAAAAEAKASGETATTSKTTSKTAAKTAEPEGPVPLIEQTRVVQIPHEARVQFPTLNGLDVVTFGANALTKVEFFDEMPEGAEVPQPYIGDSSGVIGVIGNDYDDTTVKEAVGAAAGGEAEASSSTTSSKSSSS